MCLQLLIVNTIQSSHPVIVIPGPVFQQFRFAFFAVLLLLFQGTVWSEYLQLGCFFTKKYRTTLDHRARALHAKGAHYYNMQKKIGGSQFHLLPSCVYMYSPFFFRAWTHMSTEAASCGDSGEEVKGLSWPEVKKWIMNVCVTTTH